ncbi:MAG: FecR domain-containing protein [Cyanobacteria bacterium P01_F01_bin.150]
MVGKNIAIANPLIQVEVDRWLEVRSIVGSATITSAGTDAQAAEQGDRFGNVGDRLITADESRSVLSVDTSVGFIDVFENTDLQVKELRTVSDGGKVTKLQINQGQARLRVRPFTHDSSDLEIETPAGWSAVRGTEFGVTVHPDGKTGVATLEGEVGSYAQGQEVAVSEGFQTLIIPGEPPTKPTLINEARATRLTPYVLEWEDAQTVRFIGNIDPVSLLIIENEPQVVERNGDFDVLIPASNNQPIRASVVTPLGRQQSYSLAVPRL